MVKGCKTTQTSKGKAGILQFSQKIDYSLYLLISLSGADAGASRSIRSIATEGNLSFAFLQKIAHLLKKAGIVCASRGKVGGYYLSRDASRITLKEIIEATEGVRMVTGCFLDGAKDTCTRQNFCSIRSALGKMHTEIREHYFSKKLSEFIH